MDPQEENNRPFRPVDDNAQADPFPVEAAPRFPSGRWQGYALIPPDRIPQSMELCLAFHDNEITGAGADISGAFAVSGAYEDDGSCRFEKRYMSGQVVLHEGHHVNQGGYFGVAGDWVLDERWRERFWIEPVADTTP